MSGRRAEAVRNDERVLQAAREVLAIAPDAPLSLVAGRAGVGIGVALPPLSEQGGARRAALPGRRAPVEAQARVALDRARAYPWGAFVGFMTGALAEGEPP